MEEQTIKDCNSLLKEITEIYYKYAITEHTEIYHDIMLAQKDTCHEIWDEYEADEDWDGLKSLYGDVVRNMRSYKRAIVAIGKITTPIFC